MVLGGLAATTLIGVSAAAAADMSVPASRQYVKAPEARQCPCALEYPHWKYWVARDYQWDPEYSNEIGHFRGVPPPPPVPPEEWANRGYWGLFR